MDAVTTKFEPELVDDVEGPFTEMSKNFIAVIWSRWPRSLRKRVD